MVASIIFVVRRIIVKLIVLPVGVVLVILIVPIVIFIPVGPVISDGLHGLIISAVTTTFSRRSHRPSGVGNSMATLVVLTQDGKHRLLDLGSFQRVGLGHHHLFLFSAEIGTVEQVPTLNFRRKDNLVLLQASQLFVMLRHKLKQGLAGTSACRVKVGREVGWHLNFVVILEGCIELFEDILKGFRVVHLVQVKVFDDPPSSALE